MRPTVATFAPLLLPLLAMASATPQDDIAPIPDEYSDITPTHKLLLPKRGPQFSRPQIGKASPSREPSYYRLPNTTAPEQYDITLTIDPYRWSFWGDTKIRIRPQEDTDTIVLHAYMLSFGRVELKDLDTGEEFNVTHTKTTDNRHFMMIEVENGTLLKGGRYELDFSYSAPYTNYLAGAYRSSYVDADGRRRNLVTTQFEPTNARDVFPCYDEPGLKAVFNLNIYVPPGYFAISNMDRINSTLPPNNSSYTPYSFRSSPKMSTYLLAFVVSDFEYVSNIRDGPIIYPNEFRIYAKPSLVNQLHYALDVGQRSIQYLQAYTDVNYRLPKVDHIAIPDFAAGAMENWGLVTYIERVLLYRKGITDTNAEVVIGSIMSHELAHFWFGNEVSPLWWDYLWLSEGFATFFGNYVTDKIFNGEWRLMEQFVLNDLHGVMWGDSLSSSNPMNNVVGSPSEIGSNFNSIAYSKAGSVIRMMQHVMGDGRFRFSISNYLKSLPTGSTYPEKLYTAMQGMLDGTNLLPESVTMHEVFGTWADQAGYPLLKVYKQGNLLFLTQERYMQGSTAPGPAKWWIPLTWSTNSHPAFNDTTPKSWLSPTANNFTIEIDANDDWYIFNLQQMGYYRIMYDNENWNALIAALKLDSEIHPLNRAQLINDAYVFARKEILKYTVLMDLLSYLQIELDFIPWQSSDEVLTYLHFKMASSSQYHLFNKLIERMVDHAYDTVGFDVGEEDGHVTKRTRIIAIKTACNARVEKCLESSSQAIADEMLDSSKTVNPDLQPTVYCASMRNTSEDMWNFMLNKYNETDVSNEKLYILLGLGCSEDDAIIDRYLMMTLSMTSPIPREHKEYVVRSVIESGQYGVNKVLKFLQENFLNLRPNIISPGTSRLIRTLGTHILTDEQRQSFNDFTIIYDDYFSEAERSAISTARLYIDYNKNWIQRHGSDIEEWLVMNVQ